METAPDKVASVFKNISAYLFRLKLASDNIHGAKICSLSAEFTKTLATWGQQYPTYILHNTFLKLQ